LSDLFFILYLIHISKTISKINIQKGIVYILEKLLEEKKLDDIKIFNLSFYRWKHGDYNRYISTDYIPELLRGGLIEEVDEAKNEYITTDRANRLLEQYEKENSSSKKLLLVKKIIDTYPKNRRSFRFAFRYSHNRKVEYKGKKISVDDLESNERLAIAYNSNPDDVEGFKSNIVSTDYLLALNSLLEEGKSEQEKEKSPEKQEEIIKELFREAGIEG